MYKIVALMGKAGAGKDTIQKGIMGLNDSRFHGIISCTTRPPRDYEKNGVDYNFLTEEEFHNQEMLETAEFRKWFYGTQMSALKEDKINIGVFNPTGIRSLLKLERENGKVQVFPILIDTTDKQRLMRQLQRENNPDVYEICRRFQTDFDDFEKLLHEDFSYRVIYNYDHYSLAEVVTDTIEAIEGHNWLIE